MNLRKRTLSTAALWLASAIGHAAEPASLPVIAQGTLERMGIEFAMPELVESTRTMRLPASITVPPSSREVVAAPYAGLVLKVTRAEGEGVEAGAPLVTLRSPELIAMEGEFLREQASLALARRNLERDERLAAEGAIPGRRLDATRTAYETARIHFDETRSRFVTLGVDAERLSKLEREGAIGEALTIRAPRSGVVVAKFVDVGARVDAMSPLMRIDGLDRLWVEARVPIESAERIGIGDTLRLRRPGGTDDLTARVILVASLVDADTDTVLVRAELSNGGTDVRPGTFVMVEWHDSAGRGYRVPAAAVVHSEGRDYVFVDRDGRLEVVEVLVGARSADSVRIQSGITDRDPIVVSGSAQIKAIWLGESEDG